ncbi:ATP-binding cassette domain-containing protein [Novosphingobium sp. MW5]|nr:ATP-binding cassette domain-containing protein [Novosphingobium sp. MW5]
MQILPRQTTLASPVSFRNSRCCPTCRWPITSGSAARRDLSLINYRAQRRLAEELLARVGGDGIHPSATVRELPLSRRQIVEIAKALARNPRLLILDEATSALTAADVEKVFTLLHKLREDGLAIIYISHRMHEIAELADMCTVFRNGRKVETFRAGTKSDNAIVEMMIGREYKSVFPPKTEKSPSLLPFSRFATFPGKTS